MHLVLKAVVILLISSSVFAKLSTVKNIAFIQEGEVSKLVIDLDGAGADASRFHVNKDKQIILDLKSVQAKKTVMRAFDTSEFNGAIVFVSPYKKVDNPDDIRIAIQLRDNVRSKLLTEGSKIILEVENRFGVFKAANQEEDSKISGSSADGKTSIRIPKSANIEDILENLTLSGRKRYIGKKIHFDVKDIAIADLLKMIADASGFNIILGEDVTASSQKLTLSLTKTPWDQALDTVLELGDLVATKNGNILLIKTLTRATEEKKAELEAETLIDKQEPLVTKVFPVSYADVKDLSKNIENYLTEERGKVSIDERTNKIIVKDTVEVIERIKRIIEVLDTQTPQVLIEAKIVEATEDFERTIGLQNGFTFQYNPTGPITSSNSGNFTFASAGTDSSGNSSFLGLTMTVFKRISNLSLNLQLVETENKGRVVSSPKIITQNNEQAKIISSQRTHYSEVRIDTAGNTNTTYRPINADISLMVTPQVTNDGSILLGVEVSKSSFQTVVTNGVPPDLSESSVKTNVLIDNGSTVVIGGVYSYSESEGVSGIPVLKDLPVLGWLFRTSYNPSWSKSELIIFLTPRVINQKEAGLVEDNPLS